MGCGHEGVRGVVLVSLLLSLAFFFFVSPLSLKPMIIESNAVHIAHKQTRSEAIHSRSSISPSSSSSPSPSPVTIPKTSSTVTSSIHGGSWVDPNRGSKRRVPNGPDPIHNRRVGKSRQLAGRV